MLPKRRREGGSNLSGGSPPQRARGPSNCPASHPILVPMARISRPPGFDMTYRPTKAAFLPPWKVRAPALLYFAVACTIALGVAVAPRLPSGSWLYDVVVRGDQTRVMSAGFFAALIFLSASAAVLRQLMSGVVVFPEGIETREVLPLGLPRIRRLAWAQIDRVAIPAAPEAVAAGRTGRTGFTKIRLDLWNGTHQYLPDVARTSDLALLIERVALARAIPIEGGTGMVDELGHPFGERDEEDEA